MRPLGGSSTGCMPSKMSLWYLRFGGASEAFWGPLFLCSRGVAQAVTGDRNSGCKATSGGYKPGGAGSSGGQG